MALAELDTEFIAFVDNDVTDRFAEKWNLERDGMCLMDQSRWLNKHRQRIYARFSGLDPVMGPLATWGERRKRAAVQRQLVVPDEHDSGQKPTPPRESPRLAMHDSGGARQGFQVGSQSPKGWLLVSLFTLEPLALIV